MAVDKQGNVYVTGFDYVSLPVPPVPEGLVAKLSTDGSIAVDAYGNAYVTGSTMDPTTGYSHALLSWLDPSGAVRGSQIFSGSGDDAGTSVTLGSDGSLYLTGTTSSPDFPTTAEAYRKSPLGSNGEKNIFLMKINPRTLFSRVPGAASPILYSTYLGPGSAPSLAVDAAGNAYVAATTTSTAWAATPGVLQGQCAGQSCADAVVMKVVPAGNQLAYLTFYGGAGAETAGGLAVDNSGNTYLSGTTQSTDLPTTTGAFEPSWAKTQVRRHRLGGFFAGERNRREPRQSGLRLLSSGRVLVHPRW